MVRLIVSNERESFVYFHHRHLELREGLVRFTDLFRDRRLCPGGEIKVDDLVRPTRKFVAKTKVIFACFGGCEFNRVVLFPLLLVNDAISGTKEGGIDIKVTTSGYLATEITNVQR